MIPRVLAPTEAGADGDAARALAHAIGTAMDASDGTAFAADLLALGGATADAWANLAALADEAFPDTAADLLDELERAYGLPVQPDLGATARQARLVAKVRAARAATPDSIALTLAALDAIATNTVPVHENTPDTVPQDPTPGALDAAHPPTAGGERLVFLWGVRLTVAAWSDTTLRARIDALLDQMQPAHTKHSLYTNDPALGFRCNDPDSLVGRDAVFTV